MDSFLIVELALLLGPAIAFLLVARISPRLRTRLIVASAVWFCVLAAGGSLGFRLAPRPLGAFAFAVGLGAFWVIVWAGRPKPEATWRYKGPYWIGASAVLLLNYFSATAGDPELDQPLLEIRPYPLEGSLLGLGNPFAGHPLLE